MHPESDTGSPSFIPTSQPVGFINLGKWNICVVSYYADDYSQKMRDYLPVQALVQWAQPDYDNPPAAVPSENERHVYGMRAFLTPDIFGVTANKTTALYLRLDRSQRYLAQLCAQRLTAENVDQPTAARLVQWQADWDQALAQYQHQSRALTWWQQCGLEEISEPGITERRRQPQSKPTMIQELELIQALSEHGKSRNHAHCRCHRPRSRPHGHY